MHTVMILIIIFLFAFTAYATSSVLGSPGVVYDKLVAAAERHPVRILSSFKRHGDIRDLLWSRSRATRREAILRCARRRVLSSSLSTLLATSEPCSATTATSTCYGDVSLFHYTKHILISDSRSNKAIAASPVHALPGYISGGLSWFAIPWLAVCIPIFTSDG